MRIRQVLAAYVGAGVVLAGLDAIWIALTASSLYRPALHAVLMHGFRPIPAVMFYLTYLGGVTVFAIRPAVREDRWTVAAFMGGLFGFFAYATYDLTNQATLVVWSTRVTIVDLMWGVVLTACGASTGYFAAKPFKGSLAAADGD